MIIRIFAKKIVIRIVENNDWVIITLVGCLFAYALMFIFLLRDSKIQEFLLQEYPDASNTFLSWVIVSIVYCIVLSILISQYVPIVPKAISDLQVFGYELNKFGFTLLCISSFYLLKIAFTYLLYSGIGNIRKWGKFYFTSTKLYFSLSIILIIATFAHYYFYINRKDFLSIYLIAFAFFFFFKIIFFFFHKNQILPEKWYYKILYICTLQIAPLLALWKTLFI